MDIDDLRTHDEYNANADGWKKQNLQVSRMDIDDLRTYETPAVAGNKRSFDSAITPTGKCAYLLPSIYYLSFMFFHCKKPKEVEKAIGSHPSFVRIKPA